MNNANIVLQIEQSPLSDDEIRNILPDIKIINYAQLKNKKAFPTDKLGRLIIFFCTESNSIGHWLAVRVNKELKTIEWMDSYGIQPDGDRLWISKELQQKLNEDGNYANNIFKYYVDKGYKIYYNSYDFQSKKPNISTCGRYSTLFLKMGLSIKDFQNLFKVLTKKYKVNNDQLVSLLINKYTKL